MSDRDQELDDLLKPLAEVEPTRLQMRRWARALPRPRRAYLRMAAAGAAGFLLGISTLKVFEREPAREPAGNFDPGATIETVFDKGR